MGESGRLRDVTLQQWALGSVHAALLLVAALLALHVADALAGSLSAGGTLVGGGLYLLLLASTVLTVRLVAGPVGLDERGTSSGTLRAVGWGALAGAVNGVLFFLGLGLVAGVGLLVADLENAGVVVVVLPLGLFAAAVVGLALGTAFALVDLLVDRVVERLVPDDRRASP